MSDFRPDYQLELGVTVPIDRDTVARLRPRDNFFTLHQASYLEEGREVVVPAADLSLYDKASIDRLSDFLTDHKFGTKKYADPSPIFWEIILNAASWATTADTAALAALTQSVQDAIRLGLLPDPHDPG